MFSRVTASTCVPMFFVEDKVFFRVITSTCVPNLYVVDMVFCRIPGNE